MENPLALVNFNYWFLQTIAMMLTALLIPGLKITGPFGALLTVVALAFINAELWDAALFFQMPDSFTTHAGLLVLANGLIFWILIKVLPGISVEGVLPAILAPLVFTVCSIIISQYFKHVDWPALIDLIIGFLETAKTYFYQMDPDLVPKEVSGS